MGKGFFQVPIAVNEPVKTYAPGYPGKRGSTTYLQGPLQ